MLAGQLVAQASNAWIDPSQSYYKVTVAKTGLYRLSAEALMSVGLPSATDPSRLKLFHRGVEQSLLVEGGNDGVFDAGDYVEFYGQRNDGTLDAGLYRPASLQPHSYYNLYSDSTAYFLTVAANPGKRMAAFSQAPGGLAPDTWHIDEKMVLNTGQYFTGKDENEVQVTAFDVGEGWTGSQIVQTQSIDYTVTGILRAQQAAGTPTVELLIQGRGPMDHLGDIYLGAGQRLAGSISFNGFQSYKVEVPAAWADIAADGTLPVRVRCNGVGGPDRFSISYVKVRYPQATDMDHVSQKLFELQDDAPATYIKLANAPAGTRLFDVTDPSNVVLVNASATATLDAVLLTGKTTKLLATSEVLSAPVRRITFRDIVPSQYDYIIVTHPLLRAPAGGYGDPVEAYAAYRQSAEGGGYKTLTVNVQELYDTFNYGEYSPLAIYQFMRYMTDSGSPRYLLLAGKGLEVFYGAERVQGAYPYGIYKDFVPSAGYPSSDMAYTAGLSGTTFEPAVPTGRIPAVKSEDIAAYLNKVKEMEALGYTGLWRKDVMHLSGGIYEGEPQQFKMYMQEFEATAEGAQLGGSVSALAKHSKEIQLINIASQVNKGLNLITFLGHASPTLLDFQLGFASDPVQGYNNKGKYPTLLMNGCQVGDFNLASTLFGEDWIVARDKGAIGFIGHSGYGFINNLRRYTQLFYEVGYRDPQFVTRGLGDIQQETARRFMEGQEPWLANVSQVQQMMLLGDPAVKLFGASKSDLEITDRDISIVSFDGQPISMQSDSFAVRMIVKNYGLAPEATVRVEVVRTLGDNTTITYDSLYPLTRYSDTLMMVIRKRPWETTSFGDNNFRVTLDPDNVITEYSKTNNVAGKTIPIASNGTKALFPSDFAIVNSSEVVLSWQTYDLMSDEREFILELDTTYDFSSTYRRQWIVKGTVLARQEVTLLSGDTVTYYWRTKLAAPVAGESADWVSSSFTYINNGQPGWAQVKFPQYFGNTTVGLVKDSLLSEVRFEETIQPVSVSAHSNQVPDYYGKTSVRLDSVEYFYAFPGFGCRSNTLNLVAFDRKSAVPYLGVKLEWFDRAGRTCGRDPMVINSYYYTEMATGSGTDLVGYVDNIQTGDSVVLFTIGDAYYSLWPAMAKTKLGELGISEAQINSLTDDEPVVIFGRKGDAPGTAVVHRSTESDPQLKSVVVNRTIRGGYSTGSMQSAQIGPAIKWDALHTRYETNEDTDIVTFDVYGVQLNGAQTLLLSNVTASRDLSDVDAATYPYLRLTFNTADDTYITSAQLDQWLVTYTPGPEGLLYYAGTPQTERVEEGVSWVGQYGFVNISDKPFADSITVNFEVFNQTKLQTVSAMRKIPAPAPGDTTAFPISVSTLGLAGMNDVQVFVNPRVQPEQYYDNNLLLLSNKVEVTEDGLHPVIDVSIDGRHIVDGDYVNPNPIILVRLWDENTHVLKTDTSDVRLFLAYPCASSPCAYQRVLLSDNRVKWYPATASSDFRVEFRPGELADGEYSLRVEGADAKGNGATLQPYEVTFVVKNESTITVSEAYPNPATEDVYFKVVVSGSEEPDFIQLRIMGVNGQIHGVLTQSDFASLKIGTNELVWEGALTSNGFLPNGVYIYKLTVGIADNKVQRTGKLVIVK